jgi:lipoate synthase
MKKLLILSDLGLKPTRVGLIKNNGRPAGSLHIAAVARSLGVDATNLDYWREWPLELLKTSILKWFGDSDGIWLALSGSIDGSSTDDFKSLVLELKKDIPHLKVILGGYRVVVGDSSWVDVSFVGRSTNIFSEWIQGKDISKYVFATDPLTLKNPPTKILENPVCPVPIETDFWQSGEFFTIELALGCKFNCSFCGYDFRNNKNPMLATKDAVVESLETAYNKFGMTNFILADDTINEVDSKLLLLSDVVKDLSFEPSFMAFVRLDVLAAQQHQIELLKASRINTMFFGIESLNPNVTKMIRKGGRSEKNLDTLRLLKQEYPEAFTYANFIIGLTGDSEESIWHYNHIIADEQLLTSAGCNALRLYRDLSNKDIMSDIDLNPEKFGYTPLDDTQEWKELGYSSSSWKNDWTNLSAASTLSAKVDRFFAKNLTSAYTAHEIAGLQALGLNMSIPDYNNTLPLLNRKRDIVVKKYIKEKSAWLQGF